ncbi:UNVERIFIED_CONTAM: hypothetical protein GTU68_061164 [Idotea baltica]|nr:hypothetical protein [Idotea baltica]
MTILDEIILTKKEEVKELYSNYNIEQLQKEVVPSSKSLYQSIAEKAKANEYFIISEFKRRSPSAGNIGLKVNLDDQINKYIEAKVDAISVLTDQQYFGGSYADLAQAAKQTHASPTLLLNKEFIIDPIQVYLARKMGADMILLIASVLEKDQFNSLKTLAESLGMGVLAEIHSLSDYDKIANLNCPVIGINNRDLKIFKTCLNHCNYLQTKRDLSQHHIISESGIYNDLDAAIAGQSASGFLVGSSLMKNPSLIKSLKDKTKKYFFKACGQRPLLANNDHCDLIGINFSAVSKRRIDKQQVKSENIHSKHVALFYKNVESEIEDICKNYPFTFVQLYAEDVSLELADKIKQKIIIAFKSNQLDNKELIDAWASKAHFFILDGNEPGSGSDHQSEHLTDFPYPFLLAGGMQLSNLDRLIHLKNCIGVDIASGIETNQKWDANIIKQIHTKLSTFQ